MIKENNDRIVIKFSSVVGSILALNDGKEKIIDKGREMLRKSIRGDIAIRVKM